MFLTEPANMEGTLRRSIPASQVRERLMDRYGYGDGKPGNPSVGYVATTQLKEIQKRLSLRVLSSADWEHWTSWGYVVVKNAIPEANIRRLVDLLWEFQEM